MGYHLTTPDCGSGCTPKSAHPRFARYESGFRFLNTSQGRWCSRDPIEETGGLHLYSFCRQQPVDGYDVLGLADVLDCCNTCRKAKADDSAGIIERALGHNLASLGVGAILTAIDAVLLKGNPGHPVTIAFTGFTFVIDYAALVKLQTDLIREKAKVELEYLRCLRGCAQQFPCDVQEVIDYYHMYPNNNGNNNRRRQLP